MSIFAVSTIKRKCSTVTRCMDSPNSDAVGMFSAGFDIASVRFFAKGSINIYSFSTNKFKIAVHTCTYSIKDE